MPRQKRVGEIAIDRNITLRSDGFAYRVRMMVNGARIDETFHSLDEARAFRDRKRSNLALDPTAALVIANRQTRRDASVTLGNLLTRYQQEVTPNKKGERAERLRINKLLRFPIANLPVRLVNRDALLQFMKTPSEHWTENNLRKYLMIISSLFNIAVKRWGMQLDNPVKQIELPSNGPARKRRLEPGEYEYLMASLRACRSRYMAPLVELAIETACRRGELLSLDWKDVSIANCTITLHQTKNGDERVVPLSQAAVRLLRQLPRVISGGKVFPISEDRIRIGFESAKRRARRVYEADCAKKNLKPEPTFMSDLRFHDLRHEATSRLFEKGLDVMEAASVTGHKTLAMLKGYTHLRAQRLAQKLG